MTEGLYGSIVFGRARGRINTFYELKKYYEGRFGEHLVHLRKPLLEWGGNGLIRLQLGFNLNASWCGDPNDILAQWHFYHENALAAPLIIGGQPMAPGLSLFVVTALDEQQKFWLPGGKLIGVELHADFKEYIPFTDVGGLSSIMGGIPGFGGLF